MLFSSTGPRHQSGSFDAGAVQLLVDPVKFELEGSFEEIDMTTPDYEFFNKMCKTTHARFFVHLVQNISRYYDARAVLVFARNPTCIATSTLIGI